jgi:TetR/AcrR family transcriptional repressor of nem operon
MARAKAFVREDVLSKAMQLFWEQGLETPSIQDLVDCMGIGRSSLYETFGCKESLIVEALDSYISQAKARILAALDGPGSARTIVGAFFQSLATQNFGGHTRGCLITRAALMTGRSNAEILDRACQFLDEVEEAFHGILTRGVAVGELPSTKDPRALARFFVNAMQGISVTASARAAPHTLRDVVRTTLSVLD